MRRHRRRAWVAALGVLLLASACRTTGLEVADGLIPTSARSPELRLVSWNAQKFRSPRFGELLDRVLQSERPDLVFLQEATREALTRDGVDVYFARSWHLPPLFGGPTGVATLTRFPTRTAVPLPTRRRELLMATPKTSLATEHPLPGGQTLLAMNVHCLAFERWGTAGFRAQLESIETLLRRHGGPIVLGGDFNTWSAKRLEHLQGLAQRLALTEVDGFSNDRTTASKGSRLVDWILGVDGRLPLDRVYYRGFAGHAARVLPYRASDHNPLAVTLFAGQPD